jgi:hypothetical protein
MDELYKEYGNLMIQLEILQGKIKETKIKIANELNKESEKKEKK